jgi:RHS repeat-associated protein
VSQFQYDSLNRLTMEQYQDGSVVTRSYDPYSRPAAVNDTQGGLFAFSYDANGNLLTQGEPNGTVQYTRDALGRVATKQVAGQSTVAYSYDPAGNISSASSQAAVVTYGYDARNAPTLFMRGNGVATNFTLDALGRVLSAVDTHGSVMLNTQTYSYDPAGNRVSASDGFAQTLNTQGAASTVDTANELLSDGQTTYAHDASGNRLTEASPAGNATYTWDSRNRLSSIVDAAGVRTAFKYDAWRNLIEIDRTSGGVTTSQKFVFDYLTNAVSLTDPAGLPVSVLTGTSLDSHFASVDSSGNASFEISDPSGSTTGTTNGAGSVASSASYEPYGQTTSSPPATFPFGFTGRVPVTGNILYFRARFFDSASGRFLSEDPADFAGGTANLYAYAGDNPLANFDPDGTVQKDSGGNVVTTWAWPWTLFGNQQLDSSGSLLYTPVTIYANDGTAISALRPKAGGNRLSNCFGFALAGGKLNIPDASYIFDHDYTPVTNPSDGDIAVIDQGSGDNHQYVHAAIVQIGPDGTITVIGKNGPYPWDPIATSGPNHTGYTGRVIYMHPK